MPYMSISPSCCVLCHMEGECLNHLYLHCSFSRAIWTHFLAKLDCTWVMPNNLVELFDIWGIGGMREKGMCFWGCLPQAVIWNIWKERNLIIFEDKCKPMREVIDVIVRDVSNWLVDTKDFNDISMIDLVRNWKTCIMLNVQAKEVPNGR